MKVKQHTPLVVERDSRCRDDHSRISGSPYVTLTPDVGDLEQRLLPGTGFDNRKFYAYSATASVKVGNANLTSVTGYSRTETGDAYDLTESVGGLTELAFPTGTGSRSTINTDMTRTSKFTQELRLSIPFGSRVDWLLGGFYTHEYSPWLGNYLATDEHANPIGAFATFDFWSRYTDQAAFTNFTFHITDRFDVQLGGRESRIHQIAGEVDSGPFVPLFETGGGASTLTYPVTTVDENAFTYLLTPQFRISPDTMIYARFASGYRPGGVNGLGALAGLPPTFQSDKTRNTEVGVKATVLDGLLYLDGSVYRIDWSNIQLQLLDAKTSFTFFANGSAARSEGVELSVRTAPLAGFSLGGWISWNKAVLTQTLPPASPVVGNDGDRLPFSSRWSANLSPDYEFPLGRYTASVGGDVSYVGERFGVFIAKDGNGNPTSGRQIFSGYTKTDLRAGLKVGDWNVGLYLNNVTDRRGLLGGGLGTPNPDAFTVIHPRTIGLNVAATF